MKIHRALWFSVGAFLCFFVFSRGATAQPAPAPGPARAPDAAACGTENLLAGKLPSDRRGTRGDAALLTDGAAPREGADWKGPAAVTLHGPTAFVTFDLGAVREIGAIYLQGDANDTYELSGSADGAPDSYAKLVTIANLVERGHGMRARAQTFGPASVRYLRVGEPRGDGFFSIAEVAAYCRAPSPFPPALASAEEMVGPSAAELDAREGGTSRTVLLTLAALLAVAGAVSAFARRKAASGEGRAGNRRERAAKKPDGSAELNDWLRLLFLASGCAALVYEVVWLHLLRLVIGASALSVGIVLASFMGGMFLGSLFFARLVPADRHPLRVYAYLELGIAAFGLAMPFVLPLVRSVYVGLFGYGAAGIALRAVIAAVLLLPPTALMGATLPAIARRFSGGRRAMAGLASLYAANTVGAVLGSLLAAFYLLAEWDVWVATVVAVALNVAVGLVALRLASRTPYAASAVTAARTAPVRAADRRLGGAVYVAIGLSGLTALGAQVVWTRLLTLLFGATVYAFAIILGVFLAALGVGSALAASLIRRGKNAVLGLAWTQALLVPALLLAGYLLARVLPYASPPMMTPVRSLHVLHLVRALLVIFPAAVLWGMSFPFALAAAGSSGGDTAKSSGYVYAANTIGAIAGALAVSFWAVPAYGTRWAEQALVVLAGLSAAVLFFAIQRFPDARVAPRRLAFALSPAWPLALGVFSAAVLPGLSSAFLTHGRYIWWIGERDRYPYVSEGAASTVAVDVGPAGHKRFHVSGRVEASNDADDLRLERLLGHLSVLAHPKPESVLVVGLGGGVTAGSLTLHPEVKRIVICEIEPRVAGAARQFALENYGVLDHPKVEVVFDDARHFLATTDEKFDVITSDPIHPWVRGNSILFSREYYAIVKSKLAPGGIATQWVPLYETSELAIQIQLRTFLDAFPNGTVWNSEASGRGYDVVLLGGTAPLRLDLGAIEARLERSPRLRESLREVRIESTVDLLSTYGASGKDMEKWLSGIPINRDFSLKLEYISGLALNRDEATPIYEHMTANRVYPEAVFAGMPAFERELRRRIEAREVVGRKR